MKKLLLILPFILFSCQKEASISETKSDSTQAGAVIDNIDSAKTDEAVPQKMPDSIINNSEGVKEVLREGVMRDEKDNRITRTADASMLPFSIGEEIKNDNQHFVLKITDYDKPSIIAEVKPENSDMNIRINQVRFADGSTDGPFGRTVNIPNKGKGEIWLIIGKSNMASGSPKGNFTVSVE